MPRGRDLAERIDFVLRRHYSATFTAADRASAVDVICSWDEAHADIPLAERQRHWLEIARECLSPRWGEECVRVGG